MNLFPSFTRFFFGLLASFGFTWIFFVVAPWLQLGHLEPAVDETSNNISPWDTSNLAHAGEQVYAANGCAYCHTQQVRSATSGADILRGWGDGKDPDGKGITRRTYPRDYIWQHQVFLGNNRVGADLSNLGARLDEAALYRYLEAPDTVTPESSMPAYRFLFTTRKIGAHPAPDALALTGPAAPAPGYEIVPTGQARALVAYLVSLNKGYHLPDETDTPVPIPKD